MRERDRGGGDLDDVEFGGERFDDDARAIEVAGDEALAERGACGFEAAGSMTPVFAMHVEVEAVPKRRLQIHRSTETTE